MKQAKHGFDKLISQKNICTDKRLIPKKQEEIIEREQKNERRKTKKSHLET